ncbi:hypothetical protein [Nocardia spumae]|uniref:hypothetical protein n=1 Tax=Nocardia spumae TaxID=2887190 RepID=UPI001D15AC2E|nr:hypothetical protein [Nocardia spumae]
MYSDSTRPDGASGLRNVTTGRSREILNYFGKCRACGYPATAVLRTTAFSDGAVTDAVIATCALPCGWSGTVEPTIMTMPTMPWP